MTYSVGNVPISSIQNIGISSERENEELDLVGEDTNFIILGAESADDITIDFSAYEDGSDLRTIEQQREEIKSLVEKADVENTFEFSDKKGRISVENVNIPQSSSQSNIVSGTIEGRFLPWPKHFPDNTPTIFTFISGSPYGELDIDSDMFVLKLLEGLFNGDLSSNGELSIITSLDGKINSSFVSTDENGFGSEEYNNSTYGYTNPILSLFISVEGSADGTLNIGSSLYGYNYGYNQGSSEPTLSLYVSTEGTVDGQLSVTSELEKLSEFFYGATYGAEYSGI